MQSQQNRLVERFGEMLAGGRKLLIPYVTACYPSAEASATILTRLDAMGVAAVELGFPYSDPVADGPVIQTSFYRALDRGFQPGDAFDLVASVRGKVALPIVAMVSYSIIYRYGVESFVGRAAEAGFDAILAPDLTVEEAEPLRKACEKFGLAVPMLVAPTSPPQRCEAIGRACSGFVYYISVTGTTGERDQVPSELAEHVTALRRFGKPVCVGFGISKPEHVAAVWRVADGAIVGSAIVRRLNEAAEANLEAAAVAERIGEFVGDLLRA